MTVSTEIDSEEYTGNGVTTTFPYRFRILQSSNMVVTRIDLEDNELILLLGTDYTITGVGGYSGGNVILTNPLPNGYGLTLVRDLPLTQETDLRNHGTFFAEVHEDVFDKLTMLIQQVWSRFNLSLRRNTPLSKFYDAKGYRIANMANPVSPQDATTKSYVDSVANTNLTHTLRVPEPINELPSAEERANKVPGFDSLGRAIVLIPASGSAADVLIELAKPTGAGLSGFDKSLSYPSGTVGEALKGVKSPDGFNAVGRFLNLSELRAFPPVAIGDVVYVVSAASTSIEDIHYGGGHFQAVRKQSLIDDGGVTIVPSSGTLSWVRMDRGEPCITWFGVRPNSNIDNQAEIEKATLYGKANKVSLKAPAGVIQYSKGIPLYSRSGIIGAGKDKTIFEKTTNNGFSLSPSKSVDALALAIPDSYDPDGTDGNSYCILTKLEGATFRRGEIANRENAPAFAFWAQKLAVSIIKDLRFECGNIGFWGEIVWSNIFESVQFLGLGIGQYAGFQISKYRSATGYALSGTSNILTMVQIANYQFGFIIDGLQYSTMTSCTADSIFPMTGTTETSAAAYAFYNPFGITMNACGAEGVKGYQLLVRTANYMDYDASLVVNSFMGCIEQQNPLVVTQVFRIDNTVGKFLSVVFNGGNFLKNSSLPNLTAGFITGANTYVRTIITRLDPPSVGGGADYKNL